MSSHTLQIEQLFIYPVKSLGGIEVSSARLEPRGLAHDRRWMLVDDLGNFITQREFPHLALFEPRIYHDRLVILNRKSGSEIEVPFETSGEKLTAQVWNDQVNVPEVSNPVSQWFSSQLQMDVRLVYMPDETKRKVDHLYAPNKNDVVSFADGYPVLIANNTSLADLNFRLGSEVPINRFRPNIVVASPQPYQEDDWFRLKTKDAELAIVKQCARCVMVNVNPGTGKKEKEVLAELSKYRKHGNKVYFGMNAVPLKLGTLSVGDSIEIF